MPKRQPRISKAAVDSLAAVLGAKVPVAKSTSPGRVLGVLDKRGDYQSVKAQPVKKTFAEEQAAIAAANATVGKFPNPTPEQIEKCGGGVLGLLKARRALQRGDE